PVFDKYAQFNCLGGLEGNMMGDVFEGCSLSVPNDLKYLPVILGCVQGFAELAGFEEREQTQIELAVEEAVTNVIEHAFFPGQRAMFEVKCEIETTALVVTVSDQGLPFDPSQTLEYHAADTLSTADTAGLGSHLMKSLMDRIEYRNLGKKGKETRLIKNLPSKMITELMEASEGTIKSAVTGQEIHRVDPGELEIRRMKPEEAIEVSRCFFEAYGYSYVYEAIYYPERIAAMNQAGEVISAVAVNQQGEVVSHSALILDKDLPGLAELGMAATRPRFQGTGAANKLYMVLGEEIVKKSIRGIVTYAVTTHSYSQRIIWQRGFRETGFLLAEFPESLSFKGIADTASSRGSAIVMFLPVVPIGTKTLYSPPTHREMISSIYDNLNLQMVFGEPADLQELTGDTILKSAINSVRGTLILHFYRFGSDIFKRIREAIYRVKREKLQVIDLHLNLTDPFTPCIADQLQQMGFNFTGIIPGIDRGDLMIMQYYNGVVVDYDSIQIHSEFGRKLLEYIRSFDPLDVAAS
ncbi:MAG: ATP-binding protein, partial [Bacillota bacterium]